MYLATSARPAGAGDAPAGRRPLRLSGLVNRTFGPGGPLRPDVVESRLDQFQADLALPYGVPFDPGVLVGATRNTFTGMVQDVLPSLPPFAGAMDMVLVVNVGPDSVPRRSPSCFLADALPGDPLAFTISDQGVAAAFTGLQAAAEYTRAAAFQNVLVVMLDQRLLLHTAAGLDDAPAADAVVALLLGPDGPASAPSAARLNGVPPERVRAEIEALLEREPPGAARTTLITGHGIHPVRDVPPGADVLRAPPGRPCTGPWALLAEVLPGLAADGDPHRLIIADYDRALGYLCAATIDVEGES
ncbi:hypothetical protein [Actinomadura geliboluensis]|uniref:hypothetical protein n=1 Tax=Actinomadura geliboluensis TaxID=882440 RepID=UPI003713F25D